MADPNKDLLKETGAKTYSGIEAVQGFYNQLLSMMKSIVNVFDVVVENWKLAVIGVVALVVLLKD